MPTATDRPLPAPSADALAHSARLREFIEARIVSSGGWISFADYMQHALYAPGLGYYSAGAAKFGGEGDFVTAPMISSLFSRTCARQIARWLEATGTDTVLEFGPGTGRFALDALSVLTQESPLRRYALLEVSPDLRARQAALLQSQAEACARAGVEVHWLEEMPIGFAGVVFANEVLDALPCERFVVRGEEWWRLGVGQGAEGLEWRVRPADGAAPGDAEFQQAATRRIKELQASGVQLAEGYCGEWHPLLDAWLAALAAAMERGVVLLADYGLPRRQLLHPDRLRGSLRCHYRHHAHGDPFLHPGLCDLTSWVDFSAVAESASAAGFEVVGFTTQAAFLMGADIEQELRTAAAGIEPTDPRYLKLAQGARTLLLPGEMGESVKFMLLARNLDEAALGHEPAFELRDLRSSL